MKIIAMDAGPSRFILAEGTASAKEVQLRKLFSVDIPIGSIADGIISDLASVRSALDVTLKANGIRTKPVVVAVNSNAMIMRRLEVPMSNDRNLLNLVTMEMKQHMPTGKSYTVDYVRTEDGTAASGGKMCAVKAIALPSELCEGYFKLLQELGLKARQLAVHQQVLARLFAKGTHVNGRDIGNGAVIAVDMAHFQTTLYVVLGGEVDLTRTMPVGAANMERFVADRMQGSPEEARNYIRKTMDIHKEQSDAADSIRRFYVQIIQEIRKVQQYIRTKNSPETARIYLYGIGSGLTGLDAYFSENLDAEVESVKIHSRIKMPPDDKVSQLSHYLNAAGALLKV